jgi:hypothetical protein
MVQDVQYFEYYEFKDCATQCEFPCKEVLKRHAPHLIVLDEFVFEKGLTERVEQQKRYCYYYCVP